MPHSACQVLFLSSQKGKNENEISKFEKITKKV